MDKPEIVANHMEENIKYICFYIREFNNGEEKVEAFRGICKAVIADPNKAINYLPYLWDAIAAYEDCPSDLESLFKNLISSYKFSLREKWDDFYTTTFPMKLRKKLTKRFDL